jgi:hypothetical protein
MAPCHSFSEQLNPAGFDASHAYHYRLSLFFKLKFLPVNRRPLNIKYKEYLYLLDAPSMVYPK